MDPAQAAVGVIVAAVIVPAVLLAAFGTGFKFVVWPCVIISIASRFFRNKTNRFCSRRRLQRQSSGSLAPEADAELEDPTPKNAGASTKWRSGSKSDVSVRNTTEL